MEKTMRLIHEQTIDNGTTCPITRKKPCTGRRIALYTASITPGLSNPRKPNKQESQDQPPRGPGSSARRYPGFFLRLKRGIES